MMRVLLDTHAFLWWIEDDPQLSDVARATIGDGRNELFFSAASGWEIARKTQIGKLRLPENLEQFISGQLHRNNFTVLPIQLSHTLYTHALPPLHRDPFDRILVAQSLIEKMPLLTSDPQLSSYDVQIVW